MPKKSGKRAKKGSAGPEDLLQQVRALRRLTTDLLEQLQAAERQLLAQAGESGTGTTTPAPAATRGSPRAAGTRRAATRKAGAVGSGAKSTTARRTRGGAGGRRAAAPSSSARAPRRRAPARTTASKTPATRRRRSSGKPSAGG